MVGSLCTWYDRHATLMYSRLKVGDWPGVNSLFKPEHTETTPDIDCIISLHAMIQM